MSLFCKKILLMFIMIFLFSSRLGAQDKIRLKNGGELPEKSLEDIFYFPLRVTNSYDPFGYPPLFIEGSAKSHFEDAETLVSVFPPSIWDPQSSGFNFRSKLPPSNFKTLSYQVMFSKDFDFVKGGKLPGFCGGTGSTGGDKGNGVKGFSVRPVWREKGRAVSYVYYVDQKEKWGDQFQWEGPQRQPTYFSRGDWQYVKIFVQVNDVGQKNGIVQSYLNDHLVFEKTDFKFRTVPSLFVDTLCFNTFFGGDDETWAPKKEQTLRIRHVMIE